MVGVPGVGIGIEADDAERARVVGDDLVHTAFQRPDLAPGGLQLDMDHGPVADQGQGLQQGGNRLVGPLEGQAAKVGGGVIAQAALSAGHPDQGLVVEDHRLPVRRQVDVELDAIAGGAGGLEGAQGIFRRAVRRPQAPVGHRRVEQKIPGLAEAVPHETSTTASTSTAKFIGRR